MNPSVYSGFFPKKRFSSVESSTNAAETIDTVKDSIAGLRGAPEQIFIKTEEAKSFEHCYVDETDVGNVTSSIGPLNEANTSDIGEMISQLAPGTIYEYMDHASRDLLLYFSHDLGLGMGWAIIAISFGLRLVFTPLLGKIQLNAIKMKLLEPEMKNFQNSMQKFQRMGDFNGMKQARANFATLRERYGLSNILPVLSLVQIPFLITWFISLRYVANTPDKFPNIKTDGFLWFQDLSVSDPYFILPLISAVISYHNIQISTYNATSAGGSPFARYSRYIKYVPFVAMPFAVFFPSALNLYWIITALCQLVLSVVVRSTQFRNWVGIPEYLPGSILEKKHGVIKPDIVKTIFQTIERPSPIVNKPVLDAEGVKLEAESTQSKATIQAKVTPQTTEKVEKVAAPAGGKTVEVFSNKPKAKKSKN